MTPAFKESIDRILAAEAAASEVIAAAQVYAEERLARAKLEAAQMVETAREQGAAAGRSQLDAALGDIAREADALITATEQEMSLLSERAARRMPTAIAMAVDFVCGALS